MTLTTHNGTNLDARRQSLSPMDARLGTGRPAIAIFDDGLTASVARSAPL